MPRIAPLEPPYAPEVCEQFERIMGPDADPLVLFRVVAKDKRAWSKFRAASLLDGGPLSLREREIVIDRTCALTGCEYEWGVHVAFFAGKAGLTEEQVKATTTGDADCWSAAEQSLIGAVDALHFRMTWSNEEYRALAAHYTEAQIFEILLLCGRYRTVSYIINALDLPLDPRGARFPNGRP